MRREFLTLILILVPLSLGATEPQADSNRPPLADSGRANVLPSISTTVTPQSLPPAGSPHYEPEV